MKSQFFYEALDESGRKIRGVFVGNVDEFYFFIKNNNLFLLDYKIKNNKKNNVKFSNKDYMFFLEELYYLISSGMSLDKAIYNLINSSSTETQKIFYENILKFLKEGNKLSVSIKQAAEKIGFKIDSLSLLLIETNEVIGNLSLGLKKAKEHLDFKMKIFDEIKQALSYPIFLIFISVFLIFFVFIFIIPKFSDIFTPEEFSKLPILSKLILELGIYIDNNLEKFLGFFFAFILFLFLFRKKILSFFYYIVLKFNFLSKLILYLQLSYFFEAFAIILEGGLDIQKALLQSKRVVFYKDLDNLIFRVYENLKRGKKISESLYGTDLIDKSVISLIAAGEESGNLPEVFKSVSNKYLNEFRKDVKKILSLLEPFIVILMGGFIAFIVIAIMMAVMSVSDIGM
jgi:type II secretory pathway component PulF